MAKKKYDEENGVWRTIGGRRVFIRNGESLPSAMKRSGKFERKQKIQNDETENRRYLNDLYKENKITKEQYDNATKADIEHYSKRLKGKDALPDISEAYRHYENDDERANLYNTLGFDEKYPNEKDYLPGGKKWNKEWESAREVKLNKDKFNKLKEESNNIKKQIDNVKQERYEYELYKRAKENPDSIDPMTENSTNWEALDKKYRDKYNSLSKVKNNRVVENEETGNKYYEVGNGQWRSEKDGYDYYIDFNSSNIDNPKYRDIASGRIINTDPRADNYWDYEGNGLKSRYKGTVDYLRKTTNMNNNEILELLKKIDEEKK